MSLQTPTLSHFCGALCWSRRQRAVLWGAYAGIGRTNHNWVQGARAKKGWGPRVHQLNAEEVGWVGCKELDLS